tara:strand:- start:368 stop:607 length:240 start_codon:yes stop_codon:yes gene_type:complete
LNPRKKLLQLIIAAAYTQKRRLFLFVFFDVFNSYYASDCAAEAFLDLDYDVALVARAKYINFIYWSTLWAILHINRNKF